MQPILLSERNMTTATETPPTVLTPVPPPKPEKLIVEDQSATAYLFDTARFEHCLRIAKSMASSSLLPEHLWMTGPKNDRRQLPFDQVVGNCFLILNQAIRWGIDPFSVPAETYVVANKLGFQGKLIAAVINARAGLNMPLAAIYNSGRGDELAAVIFGSKQDIPQEAWPLLKEYAKSESGDAYTDLMAMGIRCIRISVGQAKTDNQMWRTDPAQKLFYTGATKWARRHAPEIILGVLTDDDMDRMEVNAADLHRIQTIDDLADKLIGQTAQVVNAQDTPTNGNGHADAPKTAVQETTGGHQSTPAGGQANNLDDAQAGFDVCTDLRMVGKWESELNARQLSEGQRADVVMIANEAIERIRQSRPKNGGPGKQKELPGR
ncbi:MAG: recombinase RecT [Gemmataceae bacterium]|nr:recombinase RecT [Gemmataceae bacterium]